MTREEEVHAAHSGPGARRQEGGTLTSRRSLRRGDESPRRGSAGALRLICHDVAGAAVTVKLLAEGIRQRGEFHEDSLERLDCIVREAQWIAELSGRALEGAQDVGEVRLDSLVAQAVASARYVHRTSVEADLSPAAVTSTPLAIWRLVTNLIENACRAAGPTGRVRVCVSASGAIARLSVSDSGPGLRIPELHAMAAAPAQPGSGHRRGLGLRVVTDIVRECRGQLLTEPPALGGTTLIVDLPHAPRPEAPIPLCADPQGAVR
ncbi:MAG TPA: ATP-binding protein [Acidimicrobiales bacterium]|nr:ATP-binding protein [Acidimicrobiales bacterium]